MTRARADLLPLLLAAPVLGLCAWWSLDDGGYGATRWMVGALVLALLPAIGAAAAGGRIGRPSRAARIAVAALAAYTLWSFASILWADSRGAALEGSQRSLLYLLCFTFFVALPWTPRALLAGVGGFVAVVTGVAVITLARVLGLEDPAELFVEARLAAPLGYQNATAALWTMAAVPALALAVGRETAWLLRGPLLAASGLLVGLAVLSQSRGWLVSLPVVALVALALYPHRWRLLVGMAIVAAAIAAASSTLVEPYAVGGGAPAPGTSAALRAALDDAVASLAIIAGGLLVLGTVLAWLDRRARARATAAPAWARRARRALAFAFVAVIAVAAVAGVLASTDGRPLERADRAWTQFKDLESTPGRAGESRFTALGSTRYDFWRVAVDAWREHPVGGLGQDNFAQAYLVRRRSSFEEPRWTHSLPLRLLAHTGLVGALLFAVFLAAALLAATPLRRARGGEPTSRPPAAAAIAVLPAVVWLIHGSVDWLWEFPALSVPALALLGAAGAICASARRQGAAAPRRTRLLAAGAAGAALLTAVLIVPGYLSNRDQAWAVAHWRLDPAQAFARLDRARSLDPLGQGASLTEGLIAIELADLPRAQVALRRAAEREPQDWLARFELGLLASARGDRRAARREFAAARARNPRDPLVAEALRRVDGTRPVSFAEANRAFTQRVERRLGR